MDSLFPRGFGCQRSQNPKSRLLFLSSPPLNTAQWSPFNVMEIWLFEGFKCVLDSTLFFFTRGVTRPNYLKIKPPPYRTSDQTGRETDSHIDGGGVHRRYFKSVHWHHAGHALQSDHKHPDVDFPTLDRWSEGGGVRLTNVTACFERKYFRYTGICILFSLPEVIVDSCCQGLWVMHKSFHVLALIARYLTFFYRQVSARFFNLTARNMDGDLSWTCLTLRGNMNSCHLSRVCDSSIGSSLQHSRTNL